MSFLYLTIPIPIFSHHCPLLSHPLHYCIWLSTSCDITGLHVFFYQELLLQWGSVLYCVDKCLFSQKSNVWSYIRTGEIFPAVFPFVLQIYSMQSQRAYVLGEDYNSLLAHSHVNMSWARVNNGPGERDRLNMSWGAAESEAERLNGRTLIGTADGRLHGSRATADKAQRGRSPRFTGSCSRNPAHPYDRARYNSAETLSSL